LGHWNPQPKGTNRGISRKEILQRYAEVVKAIDEPCLEDVVGLTVAVDAPDKNSLIDFCFQLGYRVENEQNGNVVAVHGPDFVLALIRQQKAFAAYERSKCALEICRNARRSAGWGSPLLGSLVPLQYGRFAERAESS